MLLTTALYASVEVLLGASEHHVLEEVCVAGKPPLHLVPGSGPDDV